MPLSAHGRQDVGRASRVPAMPLIPIKPKEVWACGCTYQTSASFRDAEHGTREGFYAHVYNEPRPGSVFQRNGADLRGTGTTHRDPVGFASSPRPSRNWR